MAHTERDTFTFFPHSTSCDEGITGHSVTGPFRPNIHGIRPGHIQGEPPFNHIQPYSCSVHTRKFLLVAFLYILTHSSLNASGWPSSEWSTLVNSVYVVAGECDLSFTLHAVAFTSILHQSHSSPFVNATYAVIRSHSHDMWRRHTFASPDPFSVDYIHTHSTACKTYSPIHADSHAYSSSHIPTHKISFGTIREHSARSRPLADGVDQECELVGLVLARRGDVERVGDRVQHRRLDLLACGQRGRLALE